MIGAIKEDKAVAVSELHLFAKSFRFSRYFPFITSEYMPSPTHLVPLNKQII
jgi:hypothetical protein